MQCTSSTRPCPERPTHGKSFDWKLLDPIKYQNVCLLTKRKNWQWSKGKMHRAYNTPGGSIREIKLCLLGVRYHEFKLTYKYDLDMVSAFVTLLNIDESLRYFTLIHQQSLYRRMRVLGSRVWFIGLSLIHLMLLRLLPLGKNYISSDLFHKVNSVMCDDMSFLVFKPNYRICTCTERLKRVPVILLSRALKRALDNSIIQCMSWGILVHYWSIMRASGCKIRWSWTEYLKSLQGR